jgi:hypothetical protein
VAVPQRVCGEVHQNLFEPVPVGPPGESRVGLDLHIARARHGGDLVSDLDERHRGALKPELALIDLVQLQ